MTPVSDEIWTVLGTLQWSAEYFGRKGFDSPRLDAELLLSRALGIDRIQLYVQYERPMDTDERTRYRELVRRRGGGEPVAYILGEREFWSLTFEVEPGVLIPRPDTETLVERALSLAAEMTPEEGLRIADVGTGTGCIAIALAHELPGARVWAGDTEEVPARLAARNAARAGVEGRVSVVRGAGLAPLYAAAGHQPFHLIVSNPPYIPDGEYSGLMRDVRDFEPRSALTAGIEGLDVIGPLVRDAPQNLVQGGCLLVEIGSSEQAEMVSEMMKTAGFADIGTALDLGKRARVVAGRLLRG